MNETQQQFQDLALERAIKILSKERITSRDYLKLILLTKIIFDVNAYNLQNVTDRLYRSQSFVRASRDQILQQKLKESSID